MKRQIQRHAPCVIIVAALMLGGCVSPGQGPREDTSPIAIAAAAAETEFEVRELDIGRGLNAGKGAGLGLLHGAMLPLQACGSGCGDGAVLALLFVPFTAAAGTVVGAIAGAASEPEIDNDGFSKEAKRSIETNLVPQLAEAFDAGALRDAVLHRARHTTHRPLVPVDVRSRGESPHLVHAASGVPTGEFGDVLLARLVKVNVVNRRFDNEPKLGLVLWVDVAYVDATVPVERYWRSKKRLRHVSNYYDVAEWRDPERVRKIAQHTLEEMSWTIASLLY